MSKFYYSYKFVSIYYSEEAKQFLQRPIKSRLIYYAWNDYYLDVFSCERLMISKHYDFFFKWVIDNLPILKP